jgi:hypothetical protein
MEDSCTVCTSLTRDRLSLYVTVVKEAGANGCRFCQTIVSGIEKIEEVDGVSVPLLKSYRVGIRQTVGSTVLVETKDQASKRLYELEIYASEGSQLASD